MGSYAYLRNEEYRFVNISDDKRKEFYKRVRKVFYAGGMMRMAYRTLPCGIGVTMIRKYRPQKDSMDFIYNYFEDGGDENAECSKEYGGVYSNKIMGNEFTEVILAAYTLQGLYTPGKSVVVRDDYMLKDGRYAAWLNYLFDEHYPVEPPAIDSHDPDGEIEEWRKMIAEWLSRNLEVEYSEPEKFQGTSLSTEDFLKITHDDQIPYWSEENPIIFSPELEQWFGFLGRRFRELMEEELSVDDPETWIEDILLFAELHYIRIYPFVDFYDETMDNLDDRKILALWKIYEELLHDPELLEAGKVIFAPNDPNYKGKSVLYFGMPNDKDSICLVSQWTEMDRNLKFNKGRRTLRRYMALAANRPLREKVFHMSEYE